MKKSLLGIASLILLSSCGSSSSGYPAKISSDFDCVASGDLWSVSYTVDIEAPSSGCKSLPFEVAFYGMRDVTSACEADQGLPCWTGTLVKVSSVFGDAGHLSINEKAEYSGILTFSEKIVDVKAFID